MVRPKVGKKTKQMLDDMGLDVSPKPIKKRRRRKPMTEEQKKAAAERLAKAREKRGHTGAKSVHESIRDLPEDHYLHWKKVKKWIKSNEDELRGMKGFKTSNKSKERSQYINLENYIKNLKNYLNTGHYTDYRYGEKREGVMRHACVAMAYYPDGTPKRNKGIYYADIGGFYNG